MLFSGSLLLMPLYSSDSSMFLQPDLFACGLELLWTNIAPGSISITAYKTEKREECMGDSSVVLLNTNVCFPVSANVTLDSVSEEKLGFLKLCFVIKLCIKRFKVQTEGIFRSLAARAGCGSF